MPDGRSFLRWVLTLALLVVGLAGGAHSLEVPYLAGRVTDLAGMIDEATEARIVEKLASLESATGAQVAVLTIDSLEGEPLEDFSIRVVETWKLGREEQDDGVLLLVAKNDRKMRIEVGYGAEGRLTDAQSGRILNNVVSPAFRSGRFSEGIEGGVEAIVGALEGRQLEAMPLAADGGDGEYSDLGLGPRFLIFLFFLAIISVFAWTALFTPGCGGWFLWVFLMPFMGLFPAVLVHPWVGGVMLALWVVVAPVIRLFFSRTIAGRKLRKRHPIFASTGTFGGSSRGGWGEVGSPVAVDSRVEGSRVAAAASAAVALRVAGDPMTGRRIGRGD